MAEMFSRLIAKLAISDDPDACWEWQGRRLPPWGYGMISADGEKQYVHRLMYEELFGPISAGLFVCHHCDNPPCARPEHFFLGTRLDNIRDMFAKGRNRGGINRGEAHGMARLSLADVTAIRLLAVTGRSFRSLSREFGVSDTHIGRVVQRKVWTHV